MGPQYSLVRHWRIPGEPPSERAPPDTQLVGHLYLTEANQLEKCGENVRGSGQRLLSPDL
jgi:hypothetical protein